MNFNANWRPLVSFLVYSIVFPAVRISPVLFSFMKIKYCVTDGCACVVRKMRSLPKSFATPKLLSFLLMSGVDGVSGNCHTFCHQRAAFSVLQLVRRTASVVNLSPKMAISRHAVDILPQFFLRPDSIQVFVSCSRKTGRITSTEIDKKMS